MIRSMNGVIGQVCALTLLASFAAASNGLFAAQPSAARLPQSGAATAESSEQTFITQNCITCHNQRLKTGGLQLETLDVGNVASNIATWEKVIKKVRAGQMPP